MDVPRSPSSDADLMVVEFRLFYRIIVDSEAAFPLTVLTHTTQHTTISEIDLVVTSNNNTH